MHYLFLSINSTHGIKQKKPAPQGRLRAFLCMQYLLPAQPDSISIYSSLKKARGPDQIRPSHLLKSPSTQRGAGKAVVGLLQLVQDNGRPGWINQALVLEFDDHHQLIAAVIVCISQGKVGQIASLA